MTVPDDQHIDKVCRMASDTAESIDMNEKILIFCPSTKQVEDVATRLICCKYYSKYSEKEDSFLKWKDGIHKIMVSTSALSAGINVRGVVLVIHVGQTYGCSSFVQESGRGGREGQVFKAVTIMAKSRLEALKKQDARLMTQEVAALREFIITTTNCRRGPISEFQDGKRITCKEIDAVLCDVCDSRQGVEKRHLEYGLEEGVARKKSYSRAGIIAESVAEERVLMDYIQRQKKKLKNQCSICWACNRTEYGHEEEDCRFKEFGIEQGMNIKCENDSCCFRCGLPGDLCEDYESRTCTGPNMVRSLVTIHLEKQNEGMWNCVKEVSGQEFDLETRKRRKELEKWLGEKCRTMGENGNNMFAVYCLAIKNGVDFK
jgi:superfamily II DNA/RNA helicase